MKMRPVILSLLKYGRDRFTILMRSVCHQSINSRPCITAISIIRMKSTRPNSWLKRCSCLRTSYSLTQSSTRNRDKRSRTNSKMSIRMISLKHKKWKMILLARSSLWWMRLKGCWFKTITKTRTYWWWIGLTIRAFPKSHLSPLLNQWWQRKLGLKIKELTR